MREQMRFLSNKYLSFYKPEMFYHQADETLEGCWKKEHSALDLHVIVFDNNLVRLFGCNINLIGYKAIILKVTKDNTWYLCGFDKKNKHFIDSKDYLQSYIHATWIEGLWRKGKIIPLEDYENLCRNNRIKINEIHNKK